jgi:hypothetical protein
MANESLSRPISAPTARIGGFLLDTWDVFRGTSPHVDVPRVPTSPLALIETGLERTVSLGMNLLIGVPSPETIRGYQRELVQARALYEKEGWLHEPRTFHRQPRPLERFERETLTIGRGRGALRYDHLRYPSEYEPVEADPGRRRWLAFEKNQTAHAYLLEHPGEPRPWVVCIHGFAMGDPAINFSGFGARWLHEELGLNVAFSVLPLHGPRASGRMSGGEMVVADYVNAVHVFAQAVWDARRLIHWLRGDRDAEGIAVYGISLGGYTASLLAGIEEGLDCVIAGIPAVDFPGLARDNEPWVMRAYARSSATEIDWRLVREVTHVISPLSFEPCLPLEKRFIFACTGDHLTRPPQARALWRHWGRPEICWLPGGHVLGMWKPGARRFVADALRGSGLIGSS